jgi:hypothetical protein
MAGTERTTQLEQKSEAPKLQVNPETGLDQEVAAEEGVIEGRVSEVTGDLSTKATGKAQDDNTAKDDTKTDDALKDDRAIMREKLLESAPKTPEMKREVEKVLVRKREKLENDIKKHRRKKNYHMLSLAVMQLRMVVRQIEDLAKASVEQLKDMWLKVVHKFA